MKNKLYIIFLIILCCAGLPTLNAKATEGNKDIEIRYYYREGTKYQRFYVATYKDMKVGDQIAILSHTKALEKGFDKEGYYVDNWQVYQEDVCYARANKVTVVEKLKPVEPNGIREEITYGTLKLVANVKPHYYVVSFDLGASDASIEKEKKRVTYDSAYGTLPSPKRSGYTFAGWTLNEVSVNAKTVVKTAEDHKLKATWLKKYKLTFEPNGGKCEQISKNVTYSRKYGELPTCEKAGYDFLGWTFDKEGNKPIIEASDIVKIKKNKKIYAQYKKIKFTITLDAQNGEKPEEISIFYKEKYKLPTVKKKGYQFVGWYNKKTGGSAYISGMIFNSKKNITLYAHWKPKKITVVYDFCDDVTQPQRYEIMWGEKYKNLPKEPKRPGYIFTGWIIKNIDGIITKDTIIKKDTKHYVCATWKQVTDDKGASKGNDNAFKVIAKSKKIKGTCPKVKNAKGYQFVLSTNKKCKKSKKYYYKSITAKKNKATFKKLKKKQTYYLKYRSYTEKGKKKKWSKWSKIKAIKMK